MSNVLRQHDVVRYLPPTLTSLLYLTAESIDLLIPEDWMRHIERGPPVIGNSDSRTIETVMYGEIELTPL